MRLPKYLFLLTILGSSWTGAALAGPVEDAKGMLTAGDEFFDKAEKTRKKKERPELLQQGLQQYARAYMLITTRKLQNDVPEVVKQIESKFDAMNKDPEVQALQQDLLKRAVDATIAGKLEAAYDLLASLKELDPREWTVDYALSVIVQRMEGG